LQYLYQLELFPKKNFFTVTFSVSFNNVGMVEESYCETRSNKLKSYIVDYFDQANSEAPSDWRIEMEVR